MSTGRRERASPGRHPVANMNSQTALGTGGSTASVAARSGSGTGVTGSASTAGVRPANSGGRVSRAVTTAGGTISRETAQRNTLRSRPTMRLIDFRTIPAAIISFRTASSASGPKSLAGVCAYSLRRWRRAIL
jgi:hypothetical protein